MRTCDFCGNEIKSYGTITWSPIKGALQSVDVCDFCGEEAFGQIKDGVQKHKEAMKENKEPDQLEFG